MEKTSNQVSVSPASEEENGPAFSCWQEAFVDAKNRDAEVWPTQKDGTLPISTN